MSARSATALLPQLQVFLAVARLRSFSGAARELGVSPSAVSQSIRQLESQLGAVLVARTTRSVSLTDAGRRLLEGAGPAMAQAMTALAQASATAGETVGRIRLTAPHVAARPILGALLISFRERHPRVDVEVVVEDRFVDLVGEGYDAGIRLTEAIERDMVQVRLSDPFRFVVVGSPEYLARRGTPERPKDLLAHECLTFRSQTNGALYAWELERGRRTWRVAVGGGAVTNDSDLRLSLVESGAGLTYAFEPGIAEQLGDGRLVRVLDAYAPTVPGFFLYFPSRAQRSQSLRSLLEVAGEVGRKPWPMG